MKFEQKRTQAKDLTLVLLHSNGIPRTYRLKIPSIQRKMLFICIFVTFVTLAAMIFSGLFFFHNKISFPIPAQNISVAPPSVNTATNISENAQDPESLRLALAEAQSEIERRKTITNGNTAPIAQQLFSNSISEWNSGAPPLEIKNAVAKRNPIAKKFNVQFEIHNVQSSPEQIRGRIIILAKTRSGLFTYPAEAFSSQDNILINFAKGESFAASKFRPGTAEFSNIPFDQGSVKFQIFLISNAGKIIATSQVEESK